MRRPVRLVPLPVASFIAAGGAVVADTGPFVDYRDQVPGKTPQSQSKKRNARNG